MRPCNLTQLIQALERFIITSQKTSWNSMLQKIIASEWGLMLICQCQRNIHKLVALITNLNWHFYHYRKTFPK